MICSQVTVQPGPEDCTSLSVDTWKPATINPKSGEYLDVTVRSNNPNTRFQIGYAEGLPLPHAVILLEGTTDSKGCFAGQIPPQPDGSYTLSVCFPLPVVGCLTSTHPINVTWGAKPIDLVTAALWIGGGLAAAYIIGNMIKGSK